MPESHTPPRRSRLRHLGPGGALVVGSLAQVVTPIVALLTLGARDFGEFSLVYLLYAWGLSVQLSVCSEPFTRGLVRARVRADGADRYRSVSTSLAAATALVCGVTGALVWGGAVAGALGALAAFASVVRAGDRYRRVVERGLAGPVAGDAVFLVVFATTAVLSAGSLSGVEGVLVPWAVAAVTTSAVASRPRLPRRGDLTSWRREHGAHIRPLLKESLVLDASSVGGAYLLVPLLSVTGFGIYRAVSNVATPVRLVTEALRPLASRPLGPRATQVFLVGLTAAGVLAGVAAWAALVAVDHYGWDLGVVVELRDHAIGTAVFVGASLVGAMTYYRARVWASPRQLWRGRLAQSGTALAMPLVGAWAGGLDGAIAGTAAATVLGALVWVLLKPQGQDGPSPGGATPRPTARS